MQIDIDEVLVQKEHNQIYLAAKKSDAGNEFLRMSKRQIEGLWKRYIPKLEQFSKPLAGSNFLDYGCKFGHLAPLLVSQGVKKIFAVDIEDEYLRDGAKFIGARFPVHYIQSSECYIEVPSNSIDLMLVNEVISHINDAFLETFYGEAARVLKPGGEILISDGNNWAHLETRLELLKSYSLWESGNSKEFGESNFQTRRERMIRKSFPDLDEKICHYLAVNTSGLYGEEIGNAVRKYLVGNGFVARPHRPGICPMNPRMGALMERAFDPRQVILTLETYGIEAVQILRGAPLTDDAQRGATKNFTIRGTKLPESIEALSELARRVLSAETDKRQKRTNKRSLWRNLCSYVPGHRRPI